MPSSPHRLLSYFSGVLWIAPGATKYPVIFLFLHRYVTAHTEAVTAHRAAAKAHTDTVIAHMHPFESKA